MILGTMVLETLRLTPQCGDGNIVMGSLYRQGSGVTLDVAGGEGQLGKMVKRPSPLKKSLSAANLAALGADPLAELLMQASLGNANLKRLLKLNLAAAVGPADLALEIDKRLQVLAASRTRISWRKRPELIADLQTHRRMIADRLSKAEPLLGLDRLIAWFDLYPGLRERVKDPKDELSGVFLDAVADLGAVASTGRIEDVAERLAEAAETRLSHWAGWLAGAASTLSVPLARALTVRLTEGRPRPTGRRALLVRKLADRAGDLAVWVETFTDEEKGRAEVGGRIAHRLAQAGWPDAARRALEAARPQPPNPPRWGRRSNSAVVEPEVPEAWRLGEIAVLEAEGEIDAAQAGRWREFERTLGEPPLRDFLARLADFDDVEALDRAYAVAAAWPDAGPGLAFLMGRGALRDAAAMILGRQDQLRVDAEHTALWASRLEARHPNAALALVRSRALALARAGQGRSEPVRALTMEAAALLDLPGATEGLPSHAAFIDALEHLASAPDRRGWR